jgi:hypothetical protein
MEPNTHTFYRLMEPAGGSGELGCWTRAVGRFREVVGYTVFGELFLHDPRTDELAVLLPGNAELIATGVRGVAMFQKEFLELPVVREALGRPEELENLVTRLGPLREGEIFEPIWDPYLAAHGERNVYRRTPVWDWLKEVGQILRIGREVLPEAG